jgi:hypothetical protein
MHTTKRAFVVALLSAAVTWLGSSASSNTEEAANLQQATESHCELGIIVFACLTSSRNSSTFQNVRQG